MKVDFYCLHHLPAVERAGYMEAFFSRDGITSDWIELFLPESEEVKNFTKTFCDHSANNFYLNDAEISLYLKHQEALRRIAVKGNVGVVLEDDIEEPNFNLKEFCEKVSPQFLECGGDLLFIGSYPEVDIQGGELIRSQAGMESRYAHCYMVNPKSAQMILDYTNSPKAPFDWQLNYAIRDLNLKVYWSIPAVYQRTAQHKIPSLLR